MESTEFPNSNLTARFVSQEVEFCILEQTDEITGEVHTITVTPEDALTIMMRILDKRKFKDVPIPIPGIDLGLGEK